MLQLRRIQIKKANVRTFHLRQPRRWIGYSAAVLILLVVSIQLYKALFRPSVQQSNVPKVVQADSTTPSPGTDNAILHLANGKRYIINDTLKGDIDMVDNLVFSKAGGVIYCKAVPGTSAPKVMRYNILETPIGGYYQLELPDGSRIWLNSASRIKWPTVDISNTRLVYLEGEAYFEVTYNLRKPFIVHANDGKIRITGARVNIRSYPNEPTKATLLPGPVWKSTN